MSPQKPVTPLTSLVTFLLGAAAGAVVVALTTSRSGPTRRRDLKNLIRDGRARTRRAMAAFREAGLRSRRPIFWKVVSPSPGSPVREDHLG